MEYYLTWILPCLQLYYDLYFQCNFNITELGVEGKVWADDCSAYDYIDYLIHSEGAMNETVRKVNLNHHLSRGRWLHWILVLRNNKYSISISNFTAVAAAIWGLDIICFVHHMHIFGPCFILCGC